MESLQIGDVVELKTGGAHMTVTEITGDGRVEVQWYDDDGQRHLELYYEQTLKKVPDPHIFGSTEG